MESSFLATALLMVAHSLHGLTTKEEKGVDYSIDITTVQDIEL